jgi:hypothetical protein
MDEVKMKSKLLIAALIVSTLAFGATTYAPDPNETRVDNVHYDPELKMVVIHIHAHVLWFNIEEIYGLKVKDDTDIQKVWERVIGDKPDVVHLKKVK